MVLKPVPVTAQAAQVFPGWITGCSAGPFGGANCPAAEVGEFMAELPIGLLERDLPDAGFETFALEEAIRRMGSGVQVKATSGNCRSVDDAMVAGEIMRTKVPSQPDLKDDELALFDHLVRIVENAGAYIGEGC
jgi:hypothetical protein